MAWSWKPGWGEMGMKKQQTHTEKQDKTGCTAYSDGDTTMKPRNSGIDYVQHKERSQTSLSGRSLEEQSQLPPEQEASLYYLYTDLS